MLIFPQNYKKKTRLSEKLSLSWRKINGHQGGKWSSQYGTCYGRSSNPNGLQWSSKRFPKNSIKDLNKNLVIGSSIIGKLERDTTIPADIGTQASRGSTTKEKLRVLRDYEAKKLKTLVVQDWTNNVLKHTSKSAQENFEEFKQLVNLCIEKITPERFVLCGIPPLKYLEHNTQKNKIIDNFNSLLHDNYDNVDPF